MRLFPVLIFAAIIGSVMARADIKQSPEQVDPLDINDKIPAVTLAKLDGSTITLADAIGGKPAVLIFFRGGWCPYYHKLITTLTDVLPQIKNLGYEVLAISPDTFPGNQKVRDDQNLNYTILADVNFEAIQEFHLAFKLDNESLKLYDAYGIKLNPMPETGITILPVPAVYIVDSLGLIQYRHFNVDYRQCPDPAQLLKAAQSLKVP